MVAPLVAKIISLETAVPAFSLNQSEALELFRNHGGLSNREEGFYERFLSDDSIQRRHVACDHITDVFASEPDVQHARFERFATDLAVESLRKACATAGILPEELDGLVVTTCTGYLCPGLSSYVSGVLNLKPEIIALDMAGHGCGAALPALWWAARQLTGLTHGRIGVVSVEICTAAIYMGASVDLILSNAIFADGAAAAVVSNESRRSGLALDNYASLLWPNYRDDLRFMQKDGRLRNVLSKDVAKIVGDAVMELRGIMEARGGTADLYALHTGGRRILDEIAERLELTDAQMDPSREVLRNYGNMSSPSVLFVLKDMMDQGLLTGGDVLRMFTYGAGFTAYGLDTRWNQPSIEEKL